MVAIEAIMAADTASDNRVRRARSIYSGLMWHGLLVVALWEYEKFKEWECRL